MSTTLYVEKRGFQLHSRGTWSTREDRRPSVVWLALIWLGIIAGFSTDMRRFLHQNSPSKWVFDVHAVVFTVWLLLLTAQVLLVANDRVALHRRLGWFTASWASLMVVFGIWAAMAAKGPVASGPRSPQFLAVQLGELVAFVLLLIWGITLRKNPAAHKRIMILSTIAILAPGYARLSEWLFPEPHSMLAWFVYMSYGNVLVIALMAAWDAWRGRLMKQFAAGAVGLVLAECLEDFLYHWGPWKVFTAGLIASWGRHFG